MVGGRAPDEQFLRQCALEALAGVGDAGLGQWGECSGYAYHLRRRLTAAEQAGIGGAKDIRGTPEAEKRYLAVRKFLPLKYRDWKD